MVLKRNIPDVAVGRSPVVPLLIVNAPVDVKLESEEAVKVVNAPVFAVVAPTVPLILMLAVPVRLVTTPEDGVPRAGVTKVGEVARTLLPVPVLVTLTTSLLASSAKAVEAVNPERLTVPLADKSTKLPEEPPSTRCQIVPLKIAQSPTPQLVVPFRLVLPATETI